MVKLSMVNIFIFILLGKLIFFLQTTSFDLKLKNVRIPYSMETLPLIKLDLCSPLVYARTGFAPENFTHEHGGMNIEVRENEEFLFCYELNIVQSRSIEPDRGQFAGKLLFSGEKQEESMGESVVLPVGQYLFMQKRGKYALNQEEWLEMAIEQQKDGLWERHKLQNLLYVRYLFEDGAVVTQVFRALE
jgi:hypothetical protein